MHTLRENRGSKSLLFIFIHYAEHKPIIRNNSTKIMMDIIPVIVLQQREKNVKHGHEIRGTFVHDVCQNITNGSIRVDGALHCYHN